MSYQIITKMAYNAKNKQIETWQHSNNVWPKTDQFYDLEVRKWRKAFNILFEEYPELVMSSYEHELEGRPWKEYCAICRKHEGLAESKCNEIVARFKQLAGIV